jgi:hypothetical protein
MSNTPVLFLIFNRPETTARVFNEIRASQPRRLYVAADGPRANVEGDAERCEHSRAIALTVDWPCEVSTLFRDENMGCRRAVSSAIRWFFDREPEGIILEDDCLPDSSFFSFCETLLKHYRNDSRILHIGGNNFQNGKVRGEGSYYFSRYNHVWGWASWRRAWDLFDSGIRTFPDFLNSEDFRLVFPRADTRAYWAHQFGALRRGEIDTWDYYWAYVIWQSNGLCIVPNRNLVSNIGYQSMSTHTRNPRDPLANMRRIPIETIIHPQQVEVCGEADSYSFDNIYSRSVPQRLKRKIRGLLRRDFL